nr:GNAT family N-acetyltransferase [uncultured Brevundimonas sp.]
MLDFRPSAPSDLPQIMDIWRSAVDATHAFLAQSDSEAIEAELIDVFPQVPLLPAVDSSDTPLGSDHHGKGIVKSLIRNAVTAHPKLTVDVNEQNPKAIAFYEHLGFERIGRSALDGQGCPYPLLHFHRGADG